MRTSAAVALMLVLGSVPATAQTGGLPASAPKQAAAQDEGGSIELLELEQEVDKTLFREALLLQGRRGLKPSTPLPVPGETRRGDAVDAASLKDYIAERKAAIVARSAELKKLRQESNRARTTIAAPPTRTPAASRDIQELIEKRENAQVEVQLLRAQIERFQPPLDEALNALAEAEVAASRDESQRAKADAARREFDKVKAKYVDFSKRFQVEQDRLNELQRMTGMQGMMGGMGGMGGGFR